MRNLFDSDVNPTTAIKFGTMNWARILARGAVSRLDTTTDLRTLATSTCKRGTAISVNTKKVADDERARKRLRLQPARSSWATMSSPRSRA